MGSLDVSFDALIAQWPERLRREGSRLPRALGLPGASWHGFAQLCPIVDLPGCAQIEAARLDLARFAHHCGGFWGLTVDRLADGQVQASVSADLRLQLFRGWRDACLRVGAHVSTVHRAVQISEGAWAREAAVRRSDRRGLGEYVATSLGKVAWFPIATAACVTKRRSFVAGVRQMMLGLQLLDDALDADEDRRAHGRSIPEQLGVGPQDLIEMAVSVTQKAATGFVRGGFGALALWCQGRARELRLRFGDAAAATLGG
jgi:hypothetical protein